MIGRSGFTKPVASRLTPVVTAAMVYSGNCWLGVEKVTGGAGKVLTARRCKSNATNFPYRHIE